jgi:hypothetical protein
MDDFISLEITLSLFVIPIGLSCLPFFWSQTHANNDPRRHRYGKIDQAKPIKMAE